MAMKNLGIYDCDLKLKYKNFVLLQIQERYKYDDNKKKTDEKDGYNVTVMVSDAENAILTVKVKELIGLNQENATNLPKVKFENMVVKPYSRSYGDRAKVEISVSADRLLVER